MGGREDGHMCHMCHMCHMWHMRRMADFSKEPTL